MLPATVVRRDVPVYLEGIGNVVAYKTVTVRSLVDGRLVQVLFSEGQAVRKGEVLAQIDPRPFQVQLHQGEGALARDRAQLENANLMVKRDKELVGKKLIAQQQLDSDQAVAGQTEGAVRIDQAAIESARLNLDYARITSPVDGVTGVRLVDPGNVVHATDPGGIVVVTQLDPVAVIFNLPQDELPRISDQMAHGKLGVEVYGRDGATALGKGELELIDNQINQATSTLRLKAIVPNPERHLMAQPVRQGPPAPHHAQGCAGGTRLDLAARPRRHIRLCHRRRPDGQRAAGGGGLAGKRSGHRRQGPKRGRSGGC